MILFKFYFRLVYYCLEIRNEESYLMSVAPSEKMCFLHHFVIDIYDKRGDHTTDIDPFLFGKKFDISISGKYVDTIT
jgi:hypothetical protein